MDYQVLKSELLAGHPVTGAYDADDQVAADQLNVQNRTVNIAAVSGDELFAATNGAEFAALSDVKKTLWVSFCGRETIDPFGAANVAFVTWLFGGGSATGSSLASVRTRSASRGEELGLGQVIIGDVQNARAI